MAHRLQLVDCTLRDGGYYNNWDFEPEVVRVYLAGMQAGGVDYVELGFRSLSSNGFRGPYAYTTDAYLSTLELPDRIRLGVMVNAGELLKSRDGGVTAVRKLFAHSSTSRVSIVRVACHFHEVKEVLPVCAVLKELGYTVAVNLMQIADRSESEIAEIGFAVSQYPVDILYFADSLGSLQPEQTSQIVGALRRNWRGDIGIHTHDNMGNAMANTLRAIEENVTWVDCTVTGMGRGPGNLKTEHLLAELQSRGTRAINLAPLLFGIRRHFQPMQLRYGWGTNTYYHLAGKYNIHPTYIQEMLSDSRYTDADILAVIEHLRVGGGKKFSFSNLEAGRVFFGGPPKGTWAPKDVMHGREVLVLASGPGVTRYGDAIETYIRTRKPYVIALNTNQVIDEMLIDVRAACHPVRLLADCERYRNLPQPIICPASMIPKDVRDSLGEKEIFDFGVRISPGEFGFEDNVCSTPTGLVIAYVLALAASGEAGMVSIAGLDGYPADDPRNAEMDEVLAAYMRSPGACKIQAITPSRYRLPKDSVYRLSE